jgi:hypothetical protein
MVGKEIQSLGRLLSLKDKKGYLLFDVSAAEICCPPQESEKSTQDTHMHKASGCLDDLNVSYSIFKFLRMAADFSSRNVKK